MLPLSRFFDACRAHGSDEFILRHPYPAFVHCGGSGTLAPLSPDGATLDCVVGEGEQELTAPGFLDPIRRGPAEDLYSVLVLALSMTRPSLTIGCSSRADLRIDDQSVSAVHAHLRLRGATVTLSDNHSTGGTQVNDELLLAGVEQPLEAGDRVTLGLVELIFLPPLHFYHFVEGRLQLADQTGGSGGAAWS